MISVAGKHPSHYLSPYLTPPSPLPHTTFPLTSHPLHPYLIPPSPLPHTTFTLTSYHLHPYLTPPSPLPHTTFTLTSYHLHPYLIPPSPLLIPPSPLPHTPFTLTSYHLHPYLTPPSPLPHTTFPGLTSYPLPLPHTLFPYLAWEEDGVVCGQPLADLDVALLGLLQCVLSVLLVLCMDLVCHSPHKGVLIRNKVLSTRE